MADFNLLAFLTDASPWWWIAFAVALGAVEMLTFTYFLIWFCIAAFATGLVVAVAPGMSGATQLTIFAALSVVSTIAGRYWLAKRRADPVDAPNLNRRSERIIGRVGKALDDFDGGEGLVVIDDIRWRARLTNGDVRRDQKVSVIDADGMTLICEPI